MTAGLEVGTHTAEPRRAPRRVPPKYWLLGALAGLVLVSLLRVVTGADDIDSSGVVNAALIGAVPIGLAALGGLWSERAGVVNIGLEGMMILGTWGAAFAAIQWGPWMGLVGGIVAGLLGAALHALAALAGADVPLSRLVDRYTPYAASGEINSTVEDRERVLTALRNHLDGEGVTVDELDGTTFTHADWWVNVRPSNTEPLLRLNVEGRDTATMERLRDESLAIIRSQP